MIPLAIELHNFMCYGTNVPKLSFEGTKLLCLCGDNGNGKSAILDAMTWALWGKARGQEEGKKPGWTIDDLIHTGQTDMEVDFEFAVGDSQYRVLRKRSRSRLSHTGSSSLDFQVKSRDGYVSLTGASIGQTEGKISQVLRMDYDTFMNSAYLVQGKADEFTKKAPRDRKEVLSNILGLSIYDEYEKKAREALSERKAKRETLETEIGNNKKKLEEMETFKAELQAIEAALAEVGRKIAATEEARALLEKEKGELEARRGEFEEVDRSLAQLDRELARSAEDVRLRQEKLKSFEKALEQETEVEKGYAERLRLTKENEEWNEKLRLGVALSGQIHQLETQIEKAKSVLAAEASSLAREIAELQRAASEKPQLLETQKQVQATLDSLAHRTEELDRKRRLMAEADAEIRSLAAANASIEGEIKDLREKLAMLQKGTVRCPVCETELGADGKSRLDNSYKLQIKQKSEAHARNIQQIEEKRKALQTLRTEITAADQRLKTESAQEQKEMAAVSGRLHRAEDAGQQITARLTRKQEVDSVLQSGGFAETQQKLLAELAAKQQAIGYGEAAHAAVKEQLRHFVRFDPLKKALDEAKASLSQEKALLGQTEEAIKEKTAARREKADSRALLEARLSVLPEVARKWNETREALAGWGRQKEAAAKKAGELKGKLDYLQALRRETEISEIECRKLREEEKIYSDLALYFGKKGIQAMLIETAVPEIEEEANLLLARLTDNRLSLKLETQRARKTGAGTEETLDIRIADELGTRDYALFSGGEAFRVNFALRLALSRLLARRAGAPLPTLIIDEGFGTQDAEGRERLIEAIKVIESDFEKVIVITHIEEVKEQFPVRIEVVKGPEGSTFNVN